jgi:toxin CcdB
MAQLDVFENSDKESSEEIPYLIDVQHDIHKNLKTRMMIPFVYVESQRAEIKKLCPVFTIQGKKVFASTPEMAAYPESEIGRKITNINTEREILFSAIDFLMHGF